MACWKNTIHIHSHTQTYTHIYIYMVGGLKPFWKIWLNGKDYPIYILYYGHIIYTLWNINNVSNHQPDIVYIYIVDVQLPCCHVWWPFAVLNLSSLWPSPNSLQGAVSWWLTRNWPGAWWPTHRIPWGTCSWITLW